MVDGTKTCSRCRETKALDEFRLNRRSGDGRQSYCKPCQIVYFREWKERTGTKYRTKYTAAANRSNVTWRRANPEAVRAHNDVYRAVRKGRIQPLDKCQRCGSMDAVQAHHPDYSKPLEVQWLCARCHKRLHAGLIDPGEVTALTRAREMRA